MGAGKLFFFGKEQIINILGFAGYVVSNHSYSTWPVVERKKPSTTWKGKSMGSSSKTLFTKQAMWIWPMGCNLPSPDLKYSGRREVAGQKEG